MIRQAVDGAGSYGLFVQRLGTTAVTVIDQTVTSTSFASFARSISSLVAGDPGER